MVAGSRRHGGEDDHVVGVAAGGLVEGPAAGDHAQAGPVAGTVDLLGRELRLRVRLDRLDREGGLLPVLPGDDDGVARLQGTEGEEDRRPDLRGVDVPDDDRVADLTRARPRLVPAGQLRLLQRGTWTVPSGLVPSDMIEASTPMRGMAIVVGAERARPVPATSGSASGFGTSASAGPVLAGAARGCGGGARARSWPRRRSDRRRPWRPRRRRPRRRRATVSRDGRRPVSPSCQTKDSSVRRRRISTRPPRAAAPIRLAPPAARPRSVPAATPPSPPSTPPRGSTTSLPSPQEPLSS